MLIFLLTVANEREIPRFRVHLIHSGRKKVKHKMRSSSDGRTAPVLVIGLGCRNLNIRE
jgi:hypothetical protein